MNQVKEIICFFNEKVDLISAESMYVVISVIHSSHSGISCMWVLFNVTVDEI